MTNEMLTCHPRDELFRFGTDECGDFLLTDTSTVDCTNTMTITLPDPLIDWLPYNIEKYLPTWHLVRSYK